jgi:hypothetical protein
MARMGHDSERAAIIYQHETQGADLAITGVIDAHIEAVMPSGDGSPGAPSRSPNGPLMALGARMMQAKQTPVADRAADLGLRGGAGDENRTRRISLGSLWRCLAATS